MTRTRGNPDRDKGGKVSRDQATQVLLSYRVELRLFLLTVRMRRSNHILEKSLCLLFNTTKPIIREQY